MESKIKLSLSIYENPRKFVGEDFICNIEYVEKPSTKYDLDDSAYFTFGLKDTVENFQKSLNYVLYRYLSFELYNSDNVILCTAFESFISKHNNTTCFLSGNCFVNEPD
jgi:hypothetical protein